MKIATSELEHLREEVKNCHRIIKDLQKREFVGLTDEELKKLQDESWTECEGGGYDWNTFEYARAIEAKLKQKNGYTEENT